MADKQLVRIQQIYQKHELMKQVACCCTGGEPCEMQTLFDEIRRLNGQINILKVWAEGIEEEMAGLSQAIHQRR